MHQYQDKNKKRDQAAENLRKIEDLIAPYIRKPVISIPKAPEWQPNDQNITKVILDKFHP